MAFMLAALVLTGVITYFHNRVDKASGWLFFYFLSSGSGALARLLADYLETNPALPWVFEIPLWILRHSLSFIAHNFSIYFLTIYAIVYSELFSAGNQKRFARYLLLPILFSAGVALVWDTEAMAYRVTLLVWAAPYVLGTCFLFLYSGLMEKDFRKRINRWITALIFVPGMLAVLILVFAADVWAHSLGLYLYVPYAVGFSFTLFLIFSFINGALGVRIRIDNQMIQHSMQAVTSGTSIINHTIKNEITKINYLTDKLKRGEDETKKNEALDAISEATDHMLSMVNRIREKTEDLNVQMEPTDLEALLEKALSMVIPCCDEPPIRIQKLYGYTGLLNCDALHVKEVLINTIRNAVEAIADCNQEEGVLRLMTSASKHHIRVTIQDNGRGIPKQHIARIKEPFFTTKNRTVSHGLGLSYCFIVMQKHKGTIEVESQEGKGTKVHLIFPRKEAVNR